MNDQSRLMDMLTGYAAAHQHPFNVAVHLIGIPIIMLGVFIPLSWVGLELGDVRLTLAHAAALGLFGFYMTLDWIFALVFLVIGVAVATGAGAVGQLPLATSGSLAAAAFFGGYLAQFVGHAVEKSMPVILKHPVQANLAAPFFTVVEVFGLLRLRQALFERVRDEVQARRLAQSQSA